MIETLIDELSTPAAYDHDVDDVVVCQTHISVVFLAGDYAYKLKKPVELGFVDYSTLELRRRCCEREIELNERLAPEVYLDVVAVVATDSGLKVGADGRGDVVEWAVKMKRLDDADTLRSRLADRRVPAGSVERLGRKLADFHQHADRGPEVDAYAAFEVVKKNALDNFSQSRDHVGETVDVGVFERLEALVRRRLDEFQTLIEKRADEGKARDTHGDLRLEHVYITDDDRLFVVDCIEFNDAFRYADPVADIAFLAMDLGIRGFDDEAQRLLDVYFDETGDREGRELVDFYVAYRSCVRAKVQGVKAMEQEVPEERRREASRRARAHWNYALARLEDPGCGPELMLLSGLPAAGKSTLGRRMVQQDRADQLIETDVVRKELAGLDEKQSAADDFEAGIYTPEFTDRTYREVRKRAKEALRAGKRVAVAASFVAERRRLEMIDMARTMGAPVRFIECKISDEEARRRLKARSGDASDADVAIYEEMKQRWEKLSPKVERVHEVRDTSS